MDIFYLIKKEIIDFFYINKFLILLDNENWQAIFSWAGLKAILPLLIPITILLEIIKAIYIDKFRFNHYKIAFFNIVLNRSLRSTLSASVYILGIAFCSKYALFSTPAKWYWFIYAYIIYELGYYIWHYLSHKVRLLWCLHATHHMPEDFNTTVNYYHNFLERFVQDFTVVAIPIILGVNPIFLWTVLGISGLWGFLLHISDLVIRDARLGFFKYLIITPSHHRVHHARNPLYIDTNYSNLLNIWDILFRTLQHEKPNVKIDYGITRPVNFNSFYDVQLGEFYLLWKDIVVANTLKNRILYCIMPPGWNHLGNHKTAAIFKHLILFMNADKYF